MNAEKMDSSVFPIQIKLKGSERMLVKVKIISVKSGREEVVGEGVTSFDKNVLDDSLRIPIYDKKKGLEEIALCSVDILVTGHQLDKTVSRVVDKSRSKEEWRDHTEDAVFSQMSFTVESERE